tara:strand:- start:261 stop:506 length:246 start_codon:yes stop_codon:yes gene_type:complete
MATDIQNITAGAGGGSTAYFTASIKSGTVVVQAPMKTFGTNNFINENAYTAYTRPSGTHIYGIDKIKDKYDARFDDPTYYS